MWCAHIISLAAISQWMTVISRKTQGILSGQVRKAELFLAKVVVMDGRKEWYCRLCSAADVWIRLRNRRCNADIPTVLQGKHLQAVPTKNGRSRSASSSSGDGADHILAYRAQWAEEAAFGGQRSRRKREHKRRCAKLMSSRTWTWMSRKARRKSGSESCCKLNRDEVVTTT